MPRALLGAATAEQSAILIITELASIVTNVLFSMEMSQG